MNEINEEKNAAAKVKTGVYVASLLAGMVGFFWLYLVSKPVEAEG